MRYAYHLIRVGYWQRDGAGAAVRRPGGAEQRSFALRDGDAPLVWIDDEPDESAAAFWWRGSRAVVDRLNALGAEGWRLREFLGNPRRWPEGDHLLERETP